MTRSNVGLAFGFASLGFIAALALSRPSAEAQQPAPVPAAAARHVVVDSDGTNLEVVDTATDTLYFYTVEPGKPVLKATKGAK